MEQRRFAVLIVEDDALIGLDLCDLIEQAGYGVIGPFVKQRDAIDILQKRVPDAAVIDMHRRDADSQDLARELRRRSIPFAVHTGLPLQSSAEDPFDGALRLTKPASRDDLLAMVDRLCKGPEERGPSDAPILLPCP